MNLSNWLVVVPARIQSQRLPRKPLQDLAGKPLILRVWENLSPLRNQGARVIVATDSDEVVAVCRSNAVEVEYTRTDHPSGTDRCHEVAKRHDYPFVLNIQGDEPFIQCSDVLRLMATMEARKVGMGTLVFPSEDSTLVQASSVVKAVRGANDLALYFSRSPIPYWRELDAQSQTYLLHMGVYAFQKDTLERFCSLPMGALEQAEKLEQLRALENGIGILLIEATQHSCGIDTPEDLSKARERLNEMGGM